MFILNHKTESMFKNCKNVNYGSPNLIHLMSHIYMYLLHVNKKDRENEIGYINALSMHIVSSDETVQFTIFTFGYNAM